MRARLLLLALLATVFACTDNTTATGPAGLPNFDIADAPRDYKPGFYWLPPMVKQPNALGTFDASVSPTVQICELVEGTCGTVIAAFAAQAADGQYHVNWHTDEVGLNSTSTYRITVSAGEDGVVLGYADVQPVDNGSGLKNLDGEEFVGLVDGRTLPIKFRIETGMVGRVTVQPSEVTTEPGATQQLVAAVTDLHGDPISADVAWSSSDENVVTVDQNGLATAVGEGVAVIIATANRVSGSASFTVEPPPIGSIEVTPIEMTLEPGGTQQYTATVRDVHGNPVSASVVWSSSDESVAMVDASGLVTAVSEGTATITASVEAVSGSATVTVEAPVEEGVVLVTVGDMHSCAVDQDGIAYCWGQGVFGQLGNGLLSTALTPVLVSGGHMFAAISAAESHTCGLTTTGQAYCWGINNVGQLGNGSTANSSIPMPVAGDLSFTTIAAGDMHTCGLTTDGHVYCWGFGAALGNGSTAVRTMPTAIAGGMTFIALTAGRTHTCALTGDGVAYCWGANASGQLGTGTQLNALTPTRVSGTLTFAAISGGDAHTCAITAVGEGYCWGSNDQGRLGIGTTALLSTVPQPVVGGLSFGVISAGEAHSCAIATSGDAYCWGSNDSGRLGIGTTDVQSLVPVAVAGGLRFRSIDVGDHSCGVTTANAVYCWGPGASGRLGNGSTANQLAPMLIAAFPER
jgi:alpha-tubulin suppressor-like RCC1 family protein